jgi:hypothetical protein
LAAPAATCSLIKPVTFFAMIILSNLGITPCKH